MPLDTLPNFFHLYLAFSAPSTPAAKISEMFPTVNSYLPLASSLLFYLIVRVDAVPVEGSEPTPLRYRDAEATPNPLDYAPDFSKDPYPPYPPVKNDDGSEISIENWRGTKLFGWKGCEPEEQKIIVETFQHFHKLADNKALYDSIDWVSQAAKEIWGHSTDDRKAVQDDRKKQIKQIFEAAQQVYGKNWWVPPYIYDPPWVAWRNLWIRVQCSSEDGDPDNECGDRPKKDLKCPNGQQPARGTESDMEAFSNPLGWYSKITFCNKFFKYPSLDFVVDTAKKNSRSYQNDLWNYQNRARVLFHEITHLNYFMNAPKESPYVDDVKIAYGSGKGAKNVASYGPENIKILANYEAVGKGGFYTQRNADSYAWFAMAKYIENEVGNYPTNPVENRRPVRAPKRGDGKQFATSSDDEEGNNHDTATYDENADIGTTSDNHYIPGCVDHASINSDTFGESSVDPVRPKCDTDALSGVPFNVFHDKTNVYDRFCFALDSTKSLKWTVDAHGAQRQKKKRTAKKRTPPPNPDNYGSYNFELSWEVTDAGNQGCGQNVISCRDAFAKMADSPCGHQGGEQNGMTASAALEIPQCGTYSYKITGDRVPAPEGPPAPELKAQYCYPGDVFGTHADVLKNEQEAMAKRACKDAKGHVVKAGDKGSFVHFSQVDLFTGLPYVYDVSWDGNCRSSVSEMDAGKPLPDRGDVTCESLLMEDYKNCKIWSML